MDQGHWYGREEIADPAEAYAEFDAARRPLGSRTKKRGDKMNLTNTIRTLVLAAIVTATVHASDPQPVRLIFDTDMMGDVDDVGTAAVLHALADQGEVKILAMGVCVKNPWSPLCLDALNTYFRRPDIPLGVVKGPAHNRASKYAQGIAEEFPHALKSAEDAPDAALVYRRVLAGQPDGSVVMVSVGQLTNFRNLLKTGPDDHSNLGGTELVKRKVRVWVCMGGKFPEGREANLDQRWASRRLRHRTLADTDCVQRLGNRPRDHDRGRAAKGTGRNACAAGLRVIQRPERPPKLGSDSGLVRCAGLGRWAG